MQAKNIDFKKVLEREEKIELNQGIDPKFNHNVPKQIQEMFEDMSKMYVMEWEKDTIVMEDLNISIKPPYQK